MSHWPLKLFENNISEDLNYHTRHCNFYRTTEIKIILFCTNFHSTPGKPFRRSLEPGEGLGGGAPPPAPRPLILRSKFCSTPRLRSVMSPPPLHNSWVCTCGTLGAVRSRYWSCLLVWFVFTRKSR